MMNGIQTAAAAAGPADLSPLNADDDNKDDEDVPGWSLFTLLPLRSVRFHWQSMGKSNFRSRHDHVCLKIRN